MQQLMYHGPQGYWMWVLYTYLVVALFAAFVCGVILTCDKREAAVCDEAL